MTLLRRILQQRPRHRRYLCCLVVSTFVWTTVWIVSVHQSNITMKYNYRFYENEDFLFLPPISSSSSSLMLWNLLNHFNFGSTSINIGGSTGADTPPYFTDSLCSGCRHSIADPNSPDSERCGYYIYQQYQRQKRLRTADTKNIENNSDIIISVIGDMIAQQFPKGCSKCQGRQQPNRKSNLSLHDNVGNQYNTCTVDQYQYWRYDSVAPVIQASSTRDLWFPSSKPKQHHFISTTNTTVPEATAAHSYYSGTHIPILPNTAEYYMEYNPTIVILPKCQYTLLQLNLSHDYYVISFRVSNQNYCFNPKDRQRQAMIRHQLVDTSDLIAPSGANDYLGIIIVNASSSNFPTDEPKYEDQPDIIYDTIVDLKSMKGFNNAQDFRFFVLQQQLYISSYDTITPLWFTTTNPNAKQQSRKDMILVPSVFPKTSDQPQFQLNVWIRKSLSCVSCQRKRGFCGKNFNYFVDVDSTGADNGTAAAAVRVEVWPTGPHTVHTIDLNKPCRRGSEPTSKYIGSIPEIQPTFPTMEEVDFPALGGMESIFTRGRGSACCISLRYPDMNRTVLVGIQHTKTPSQRNKKLPPNVTSNQYLSSFYAFESNPPYNIIAQTGWFCLEFPEDVNDDTPTTTGSRTSSLLHRITFWRKLVLGGRTYNCPRIHFVSGMTIKVNDPNSVILAYGINDCYSRFVEIRLSDISDLLFIGPTL